VNPEGTSKRLLRLYPAGWRARYGDELEALILETNGGRVPWRVRADVALAAADERLRGAGLAGDGTPPERMRGGTLVVLCAWALFVVAGVGVQKFSEHWQAVTPSADQALPAHAFDALAVAAAIGSVLVMAGVAATLPSLLRFLRAGSWRHVRPLHVALGLTVAAVPLSIAVIAWAHQLNGAQRNGHDAAYATVWVLWSLVLIGCLAAWTVAGVTIARRLELSTTVLRFQAVLGAAVALSMVAMTAATAVWWAALAQSAPWALAGVPTRSTAASPLAPTLLVIAILMLVATTLATTGAVRAVRAAGEEQAR
jgi:hypothetical protein